MKQSDIAAVIERDLLRAENKPNANIVACRSCGRTLRYRGMHGELNGNLCSLRCQDWYDAGNPALHQDWRQPKIIYRRRDGRPMKMGRHGFPIHCAHCGQEFDSKGLRCCSRDCEQSYRERQDNLAVVAEVGMAPTPRRQCQTCGARIPKWRKGRKVSSATRVCSRKCARRPKTPEAVEMDSKR
jgi:hypothetical protein